jgi:Mce-associated membrane protein
MTVERGSSLDGTEAAIDGAQTPPADEDGGPRTHEGPARLHGPAAIRRRARRYLARWRSIVATTLVVATVGVAAGVYFILYRPDQQVDDAAAHRAIRAASDGAVAVLSYSHDHLNRDFNNAKSHLTGDFLAYYSKFTDDVVAPTAEKGQLTATAKVIRAAVSELHPDSAVVLVFVNQITASVHKKDPEMTRSSVLVTLKKVNGSWLIAKFDPAG